VQVEKAVGEIGQQGVAGGSTAARLSAREALRVATRPRPRPQLLLQEIEALIAQYA